MRKTFNELIDELESFVEGCRVAYEDNPDWKKEIKRDVKKCINILDNWN